MGIGLSRRRILAVKVREFRCWSTEEWFSHSAFEVIFAASRGLNAVREISTISGSGFALDPTSHATSPVGVDSNALTMNCVIFAASTSASI